MSYVPNNITVFVAAFAGVMAGSAASGKVPQSPDSLIYSPDATVAGAYAQAFDTQWGLTPPNSLELALIEDCSYGAWDRRSASTSTSLLVPSAWNAEVLAIIAEVHAASTYFANAGITPASVGGGSSGTIRVAIPTDANFILPAADTTQANLIFSSTVPLTGARIVSGFTLPATDATSYQRTVYNNTTGGFNLIISNGGAGSVAIGDGETAFLVFEPTGVRRITDDSPVKASGGVRSIPAVDANVLINWDMNTLFDGSQAIIGTTPTGGYLSTGTAADLLQPGFSNGNGGTRVIPGPTGGPNGGRAANFYFSGSDNGGAGTAQNPSKLADNQDFTMEVWALIDSLTSSTQGVLFTKAFGATWVAPFNGVEMNLASSNDGAIEVGFTPSASPGSEIGVVTSGRARIQPGYHYFVLRYTSASKRFEFFIDGTKVILFDTTASGGPTWGTGKYMVGANSTNNSDTSNTSISTCRISGISRSDAYIRDTATAWIPST